MEHILDISKHTEELHDIFKKIRDSNTILFLGAGASVGTEVGSGFPPHAAKITASKRAVPRSTKLFFIDICDILLSLGVEVGRLYSWIRGTS